LNPYLTFDGQCEAAFKFYEQCLGGKIKAMMAGTPAEQHVPSEWRTKILHTRLKVGDEVLMGSDAPPERYEQPKGFSVSLQIKDPAREERIILRIGGKRNCADADSADLLGRPFWHAGRSIRYTVDG
jgi:PhnB protein